jgi:hypothetical protein
MADGTVRPNGKYDAEEERFHKELSAVSYQPSAWIFNVPSNEITVETDNGQMKTRQAVQRKADA